MKQCNKIVWLAAVVAFLTFDAGSIRAQGPMETNVVTITLTALVQGGTNDNGTVTTIAAPTKVTLDTKEILALLAMDENKEGKYSSTTFPAGAKLVGVCGSGHCDYQVFTKDNVLIVDVSDILHGTNSESDVISGKQNDTSGLPDPTQTKRRISTLIYDDTAATGKLQFALTGLHVDTTTAKGPAVTTGSGNYTLIKSSTITPAVGDGNYQGTPMVITGSFSASGSGTFSM